MERESWKAPPGMAHFAGARRIPAVVGWAWKRVSCLEGESHVPGTWRNLSYGVLLLGVAVAVTPRAALSQLAFPDGSAQTAPNPLTDPTVKPGKMMLFDLEARFAKDVLERGGAAFAEWFAEDGVALGNGQAPLVGKVAIAKSANWSPKDYQLTWTPTDATMGPSGDVGYTWGHFEGHSKDANGNPVLT